MIIPKKITLALGLAAALVSTPLFANGDHGGMEGSPLYEKMEKMQDHYRDLGRGLRRASPETAPDLIEATRQLQILAVECKSLEPYKTKEVPVGERSKFLLAYQIQMIDTIKTMLDIENALLIGNYEQADELFDKMKEERSKGHKEFKAED